MGERKLGYEHKSGVVVLSLPWYLWMEHQAWCNMVDADYSKDFEIALGQLATLPSLKTPDRMEVHFRYSDKKINIMADIAYKNCHSKYRVEERRGIEIDFEIWDEFEKMCEAYGANPFDEAKILMKARVLITPTLADPWDSPTPEIEISPPSPC